MMDVFDQWAQQQPSGSEKLTLAKAAFDTAYQLRENEIAELRRAVTVAGLAVDYAIANGNLDWLRRWRDGQLTAANELGAYIKKSMM